MSMRPTQAPGAPGSGLEESGRSADFVVALARMGLLAPGESPRIAPLAGGVSSDIVRADLARGPVCVKRALRKLKVQADWQVPVERNAIEVQWMRAAGAIAPDAVPRILGEDRVAGMFAMDFLDEVRYPVWKTQLRDGCIDAEFAAQVGAAICLIHSRTAGNAQVARTFATDDIFYPIRLEPYLIATAGMHADVAKRLRGLAQSTLATKTALVHGDVSPKNILAGPRGPVFLDAECAWYGDPAFDLAFCLNHLLLKCLWRPQWSAEYLAAFRALASAYLEPVDWEPRSDIETRAAHLLPGLFLARVDGKSPVEYLTEDWQRERVREVAKRFLHRPADTLQPIHDTWHAAMQPPA
jgi:tRNA A-37 threonylcarbamoyl transferase component Bud32